MSTLTTSQINTANGTTNLTLTTGNTVGGASIVLNASTANVVITGSASVSTNTLVLGTSSITATQFANGYTRLPNGLMMQWGTVSSNSSSGSVTFPAAFAPVLNMIVSSNSAGNTNIPSVTALSNTTATVLLSGNTTAKTVYWQAIGL
jgi:hypothetical protein